MKNTPQRLLFQAVRHLKVVVPALLTQEAPNPIWITVCCLKTYVGMDPAEKCSACGTKPDSLPCTEVEQIQGLVEQLFAPV